MIRGSLCTIKDSADWEIVGPVVKSRECDVYKASLPKDDLVLAVKSYSPDCKLAAPQQQADALMRCQDSMAGIGRACSVPKVFAYDKDKRILIMEWINGRSLHHCLWSLSNKERLLTRTGQWLRTFHEVSVIDVREVQLANYLKVVEKWGGKYQGELPGSRSARSLFTEACDCLRQMVSLHLSTKVPHAILHGDFTPPNLFLNKEQIVGLDIWGTLRKPILDDLTRMVVYLTIAYPLVTRQLVSVGSEGVRRELSPFLEGYGKDLVNLLSSHYRIALLTEYLRRWLVIANRPRTPTGTFTNKYQLFQIQRQVVGLLECM